MNVTPVYTNSYYVVPTIGYRDLTKLLLTASFTRTRFRRFLKEKAESALLVKVFENAGFSFYDEHKVRQSFVLKNDANGIEAYLAIEGDQAYRLTVCASKKSYGIDPDYLKRLEQLILRAGFFVDEIEDTKRLNLERPYDWNSPVGRAMLAGANTKKFS